MARKSFKKGVKNVIDSIDNDKKEPKAPKPTASSSKSKTTATKSAKKAVGKNAHIVFNLGNRFIVPEVHSAMEKLNKALTQTGEFQIESDEVTELDLSYIQMIIAFHKLAESKKLRVSWKLRFTDDIIKSMQQAGLYEALLPFFDESMAEVVANG